MATTLDAEDQDDDITSLKLNKTDNDVRVSIKDINIDKDLVVKPSTIKILK